MQTIPYQIIDNQILALLPDGEVEFLDIGLKNQIDCYNDQLIEHLDYKVYVLSDVCLNLHNFHTAAPLIAFIEVTNLCNLECKHCYASSRHRRENEMSTPMIFKLIDEFDEMGVLQVFLTGGEIFTHKDAVQIIQYASTKKFTTQIFTNGTYVTEKIVQQMPENVAFAISFDTASPERTVRGKMDYPKLKEVFDLLRQYNLPFRTAVSVHKNNINDVEEIFEWCILNGYPRPQWLETFASGRALRNLNILLDESDFESVFEVYKRCMDKYCVTEACAIGLEGRETANVVHSIKTIQMVERLEVATRVPKLGTTMAYINSAGEVFPDSSCLDFPEFIGGSLYGESFYNIWHNGFGNIRKYTFEDFKFCSLCPINQSGMHCHFRDYGLSKNIMGDYLSCGATEYVKLMIMNTHDYWLEQTNNGYKLKLVI